MKAGGCIVAGLLICSGLAMAQESQAIRISQFSGKPVPRFESLRYAAANGRIGPGRDHRILWRYEREGLPMLIIKESNDWRRVRDPDGVEVWMHKRMLGGKPAAIVRAETQLLKKSDQGSQPIALLKEGVIVGLETCQAGWCQISVQNKKGFVPARMLWGPEPQDTPL